MRYIKFRILSSGYSAESGKREWQYYTLPYEHPDHEFGLVEEETIGLYTGLKDKNGVDVYEGDVIEAFELRYVVEWCQNLDNYDYHILTPLIGFAFRPLQEEQSHKDFKSVYFGERFEVIGNIYENPELLGGKDGEN